MDDGSTFKQFLRETYHEFTGTPPGEPIPPTAAAILTLAYSVECTLSAEGAPLFEWVESALERSIRDGVRGAIEDADLEPNLVLPREASR